MSYVGGGEVSARLHAAGEQRVLSLGPTEVTVVADLELTGGAYTAYLLKIPPGAGGAAAHFHRTFTESFQVLSGEFEVYDGKDWSPGRTGDHLVVPPGGIHGFRGSTSSSDVTAEVLLLTVPGLAREDYFVELAEVSRSGRLLSDDEWTALFARHDQYMV